MNAPLPPRSSGAQIGNLAELYRAVRRESERRAAPLSSEDQQIQSMPDCSPTKWHLGHTSWFFETFILSADPAYRPFHPAFRTLFNSYYEAVGPRHPRPQRGLLSRPSLAEVMAYRAHVDGAMERLLEQPENDDASALLALGLNHEQQHQELILTDIKHTLSVNLLHPAYEADTQLDRPVLSVDCRWATVAPGLYEVGAEGAGFAFDNETPRHRIYLQGCQIANRPVTCAEYAAFIDDGGYRRPELWLSDGWAIVQAEGWEAPLYWSRGPDGWQVFTLSGNAPLGEAEPAQNVSFYEASAYAAWAGKRLPTEFEWEIAFAHDEGGAQDNGGESIGTVWEWTASAYAPYPGYRPPAGAVGEYNGKFMSGQMVLRGGSWATPEGHARPTYRNFFPPSARWQASGFRLAEDS